MPTKITAAALCAMAISVVSANAANEFYIVLNASQGRCELTTIPPQTTAFDLLADGVVFFDRQQAQRTMQSLPECSMSEISSREVLTRRN